MLQAEQDALVLLAQQGNREALDRLIRHLQPDLLRFAYRLCHDKDMAQDAVQQAWVSAIKKLYSLRDPRVLKSWMLRAVKWRVNDLLRKLPKNTISIESADSEDIMVSSAKDDDDLGKLIKQLPEEERRVIYLFYGEGLSLSEISLVEEIPIGTVKSRMNRARNRLQTQWSNEHES